MLKTQSKAIVYIRNYYGCLFVGHIMYGFLLIILCDFYESTGGMVHVTKRYENAVTYYQYVKAFYSRVHIK